LNKIKLYLFELEGTPYLLRNIDAVVNLLSLEHRMKIVQQSFQMSVSIFKWYDDGNFLSTSKRCIFASFQCFDQFGRLHTD